MCIVHEWFCIYPLIYDRCWLQAISGSWSSYLSANESFVTLCNVICMCGCMCGVSSMYGLQLKLQYTCYTSGYTYAHDTQGFTQVELLGWCWSYSSATRDCNKWRAVGRSDASIRVQLIHISLHSSGTPSMEGGSGWDPQTLCWIWKVSRSGHIFLSAKSSMSTHPVEYMSTAVVRLQSRNISGAL
jgi:hypothetical protein